MEPSAGEILTMMLNYLVGISVFSLAAVAVAVICLGTIGVLLATIDCAPDFDEEDV